MPESKQAPKAEEETLNEASIPDDIKPLFVATQGQQIFGCVADEDVTDENPHKLIPKDLILQDFLNRAGVSDFKEVKAVVNVRTLYNLGNCFSLKTVCRATLVMNCYWCMIMNLSLDRISTCV